jgi:GntR family transcriptional regulator, carbon starvation induced regulator
MPRSDDEYVLSIGERAYRTLREAIVRCEFEPEARLRVEELSERYSLSSSPLREALQRLAEQGFVCALENRGFRVSPLTKDGVSDLSRVRQLVEGEALRDAITNGNDEWEAACVGAAHALSVLEKRMGEGPRALNADWSSRHRAFHLALYSGCSSQLMRSLVDVLFDNAERYRCWTARHRAAPRRKNDEHQRLLAATLARDADTAVTLLRQHISATERHVVDGLTAMSVTRLQ